MSDLDSERILTMCDEIDRLRESERRWGTGECCADCPHHGFDLADEDFTWETAAANQRKRAQRAESSLARVVALLDREGSRHGYEPDALVWVSAVRAAISGVGVVEADKGKGPHAEQA